MCKSCMKDKEILFFLKRMLTTTNLEHLDVIRNRDFWVGTVLVQINLNSESRVAFVILKSNKSYKRCYVEALPLYRMYTHKNIQSSNRMCIRYN